MVDFGGLTLRRINARARAVDDPAEMRALDRLSDGQLAAVELIVHQGLWAGQIARRLAVPIESVRAWIREPLFSAAVIEMTRAVAAAQLVPYGLARIRQEMARPDAKLRELVQASRFAAELAGMYATGTPLSGAYAPGSVQPGKPLSEMTRAELERLASTGLQRLDQWAKQHAAGHDAGQSSE